MRPWILAGATAGGPSLLVLAISLAVLLGVEMILLPPTVSWLRSLTAPAT